jgi:hypothetical protein
LSRNLCTIAAASGRLPAVIAGLDPAIHHCFEKMDARVKPAHDGAGATILIPTGRNVF